MERLAVIPNWPDPSIVADDPDAAALRDALGLAGRFVVLYSGNFGRGHAFGGILEAAEHLRDTGHPIVFVLAGQGSRRAEVADLVRRRRLETVRLLPPWDRSALSAALSLADVHIASLHEAAAGLMVPSKVYGALASGRPCIFLGPAESEVARVITETGSGIALPSTDGAGLAGHLADLAETPQHCRQLGARAAEAVAPFRLDRATKALSVLALEALDVRHSGMAADRALLASLSEAVTHSDRA